jgi:hypothetical protein
VAGILALAAMAALRARPSIAVPLTWIFNVFGFLDLVKARGWLEVVPDEDGRSQPFRLTPQGRKLLERAGSGLERGATAGQEGF